MRPDFTKAQFVASLVAGVPIVAGLLAAFGVWHPTHEQVDSLKQTVGWAAGFGGLLVGSDAHLRAARNKADATKAVAAATAADPAGDAAP